MREPDEKLAAITDPWMLVYFVGSKILHLIESPSASAGMIVAVFFALYFFTALRGTYLWHSKYRHEAMPEAAS